MPATVRGSIADNVVRAIELSPQMGRRTTRRVLEHMKDRIAHHTPVETGELKASWYIIGPHGSVSGGWSGSVTTEVSYAPHVEWDTAPHIILPKKPDGVLVFEIKGNLVFAKRVHHPGTKGQHMVAKGAADTARVVEGMAEDELRKWARETGF